MTPQKLPLEITDQTASGLENLHLDTDLCVLDCLSEIAGAARVAAGQASATGQAA